jgi:ribosomal protein S18 acetylase RimI-like enzyme
LSRDEDDISLRPMLESELDKLPVLWTEAGLPYRPQGRDSMPNLKAQLMAAPDLFIGAFSEDRLLGAVIASDDGRKGWINRLAVHPSARNAGIGKGLVRACEDALRRRGRELFAVLIERDNEESMEFFEKTGYKFEEDILYYTKRERESF